MSTVTRRGYWLFSPTIDLLAFVGSAALALLLLAWGGMRGLLSSDTPEWAWVPFVLMVDVAHVYATGFRVYFDSAELRRRPGLYVGVPLLSFLAGIFLYGLGELTFWRVLAYLAVFHFVRQQYGWVALYRAKAGESSRWQRWVDNAAIYLATIYPLLYWHGHLPRNFNWFLDDDFQSLPAALASWAAPCYWLALLAYAAKGIWLWTRGQANPGKDAVVATTAVCWYVGIVAFNSDYAFTVTNVIIHGVPYLVLVWWYMRRRNADRGRPASPWRLAVMLLATVWLLAYAEELLWDRYVWQEHSWLFGIGGEVDPGFQAVLVPLLAVPQLTHYVLDGFIWKSRNNPNFRLASHRSTGRHTAREADGTAHGT